jgi:hypothetical protein
MFRWFYNLSSAWKLYTSGVILICLTTVISFTVLDGMIALGLLLLVAALFKAMSDSM